MSRVNTALWPLKCRIREMKIDYSSIAEGIGRSPGYVALRMRGIGAYTTDEAYAILEMIGEEPESVTRYFPPTKNKKGGLACLKSQ